MSSLLSVPLLVWDTFDAYRLSAAAGYQSNLLDGRCVCPVALQPRLNQWLPQWRLAIFYAGLGITQLEFVFVARNWIERQVPEASLVILP
jgi:hypothetical protein